MNGESTSVWTTDFGIYPPESDYMGKSYIAWACAGCFGKSFIQGFKHGVTTENRTNVTRNTTITATVGSQTITLQSRRYSKDSHFKHEFFNPMGHAPNGPIDTSYVSYLHCGKDEVDESQGSYSTNSQYINSVIYFADLRNDILVYYKEEGSSSGSTAGNKVMGSGIAYGGFMGGESSCFGVNTRDAIKMQLELTASSIKSEIITLGNHTPFAAEQAPSSVISVAASDRSGYCGGVSFECVAWGSYARVDTDKPYNCEAGEYEEEALTDRLEDFYNAWDAFGAYRSMDDYDSAQFDGSYNGFGINKIADGTYDYPVFVNIDPMPHGSFCIDKTGNYFYSMITKGLTAFNSLNGENPKDIAKLTADDVVFYPLAPV